MKHGGLTKKTLLLWQFRVVMSTTLLVALCVYFASAFSFLYWVALGCGLFCLTLVLWYLPRFFSGYKILIKNSTIIINCGVFIKVSHIMPFARLIYAQTFVTPLARFFGVTALSLKGTRSRVVVPEIDNQTAAKIMELIASGEMDEE